VGDPRSGKGHAGDFVLDAGALIAVERGNQGLIAILGGASVLGCRVVVPASVLAQAWRGEPRSAMLARLVEASEVDPLNEKRAKEVGVRLSRRDANDIADAHVVCCACEQRATVVTSDSDDIQALAEPGERLNLIAV
jgi:predicted nucleic acid-binding protein